MSSKTDTQVIIGGKVLTLSGYESEEYLQKVASYLNGKLNEVKNVEGFSRQPTETQNILLQLNIADDYFKVKKQVADLEEQVRSRDKEMYDLKHELISTQIKLETSEQQAKELQAELNENARKMIRMEMNGND